MSSIEDLPERPEWLPEACYSELVTPGANPPAVQEMARRLCFAPVMRRYWRSETGTFVGADSRELWNLAAGAVEAQTGETTADAVGGFGVDPGWFLKSHANRKELCDRIERLACELRQAVADTHFDRPVGMALIVGKVRDPETRHRPNGPSISLVLSALEADARSSGERVAGEPAFSKTHNQRENYRMTLLYRLHRFWFEIGETAARKRAGEVAAAIEGLGEPIHERTVRNMIRGRTDPQ